jgi:mediator of RNA polymerase II transcription subunit 12
MDWLVSGLENSSQAKLPMWLLVTQIYWKDLLRLRKYGRRLVVALLSQNTTVRSKPTWLETSRALLTTETDSNSPRQ